MFFYYQPLSALYFNVWKGIKLLYDTVDIGYDLITISFQDTIVLYF